MLANMCMLDMLHAALSDAAEWDERVSYFILCLVISSNDGPVLACRSRNNHIDEIGIRGDLRGQSIPV